MYLLGHPFIIETDNRTVKLLFANTKSRPPARIERLALRLSQFDFEIAHKPGETNVADYYSRQPSRPAKDEFMQEVRAGNEAESYIDLVSSAQKPRSISLEEIQVASRSDPEIQALLRLISRENGAELLPKELSNFP